MPRLSELVPEAADHAGWKVDRITHPCFGAQTGSAAVPILFVRAADHTAGDARVLDVCLPLAGRVEEHAVRELAFTNGTGCEGRISHLKRRCGMRQSRLKGHDGARTWAAWAILAYNLDTLAIRST